MLLFFGEVEGREGGDRVRYICLVFLYNLIYVINYLKIVLKLILVSNKL